MAYLAALEMVLLAIFGYFRRNPQKVIFSGRTQRLITVAKSS